MANVACFCGCSFSFEGGAGACPQCGEVASLMPTAAPEIAVRDWPEEPVLAMNVSNHYEELPDTWSELVSSGVVPQLVTAYSKAAGSPAP